VSINALSFLFQLTIFSVSDDNVQRGQMSSEDQSPLQSSCRNPEILSSEAEKEVVTGAMPSRSLSSEADGRLAFRVGVWHS
jgi:hypothetical protein